MYQSLKSQIPLFWLFYKWYLTDDGEHVNFKGTAIVADKLAEAVGEWLKEKNY